jgi:hypothetical protein
VEEIVERELQRASVLRQPVVLAERNQPPFRGDGRRVAPERAEFDVVDALPEGVERNVSRFEMALRELLRIPLVRGQFAEFAESSLLVGQHLGRQHAAQPRAQHAVVQIGVRQHRRSLYETHDSPRRSGVAASRPARGT